MDAIDIRDKALFQEWLRMKLQEALAGQLSHIANELSKEVSTLVTAMVDRDKREMKNPLHDIDNDPEVEVMGMSRAARKVACPETKGIRIAPEPVPPQPGTPDRASERIEPPLRKSATTRTEPVLRDSWVDKHAKFGNMSFTRSFEDASQEMNDTGAELRLHSLRPNSLPNQAFNRPCAGVVLSAKFDLLAGLMVFLSAVFVGVRTDYFVRHPDLLNVEFKLIESAFCLFFVIEVGLRVFVLREKFFQNSGWEWNILDIVLTSYQVVQEIIEYVFWTPGNVDARSAIHRPTPAAMYLRFLRFLRILRVIRIGVLQKYVMEFRVLASSVVHSVRYLLWASVILLVVIYVFAVHITLLVGRHAVAYPEDLGSGKAMSEYWGSLPRSMLSLFQAITSGEDWAALSKPLTKISYVSTIIFCVYICFTAIYIMNVITGVFVETVMEAAEDIHDDHVVSQLRDFFELFHSDKELTWEEFSQFCAQEPQLMKKTLHAARLDASQAKRLFVLLDTDGSGTVSKTEFVTGCLRLRGHAKSIDLVTLMYEFRRTKKFVQAIYEETLTIRGMLNETATNPVPLRESSTFLA